MERSKNPRLTARQLSNLVLRRLKRYDGLNGLEQFAMFMGKTQVLEFGLKGLLSRLYNYESEAMQRWTLGRTTSELKKSGLRADYIVLLESLVEYRNYIAHEYLANDAILRQLLGKKVGRLERKHFEHGMYELEQAMVLFDWCQEHDAWTGQRNQTLGQA
jgi:hypothetical protein